MRTLGLVIWALAIAAGLYRIRLAGPLVMPTTPPAARIPIASLAAGPPQFRAAHAMSPNYRVGPGDFESLGAGKPDPSTLTGKYLGLSVSAGDGVPAAAFTSVPDIEPSAGRLPYAVSLQSPILLTLLNAGSRVDVWRGAERILESTRVLAVMCAGTPESCSAMLEVPAGQAGQLTGTDASKLQLVVRKIRP